MNKSYKMYSKTIPLLLFCLLLPAGCTEKYTGGYVAPIPNRMWYVYKGEREVLFITDRPGSLTSTAHPPPGFEPPQHPFLTASAMDIMEEGRLRDILDQAKSLEEFLSLLEKNGYRVEEVDLSRYRKKPPR